MKALIQDKAKMEDLREQAIKDGSLHDRVQGFDQNGHMLEVGRYPRYAGSFRSMLGFGVLF